MAAVKRLILPVLLICSAVMSGCNGPTRAEIDIAAQMNAQSREANSRARIDFDPGRDVLIADFAPELILNYRILTAIQSNRSSFASPGYTTHRMVKYPDCRLENDNGWAAGASIKAISDDRTICWLQTRYEPAPQGAVVATTRHRKVIVDGVETNEHRITIRRPDGASTAIVYYSARNETESRRIGWQALASALGLAEGHGGTEGLPDKRAADGWIAASLQHSRSASIKALEALAATGRAPEGFPYTASRVPPEAIVANADGLMQQLDLHLAGKASRSRPIELSRTLALLPDDEWARRAPQILSLFGRHSPVDADDTSELLIRLSELGAPALPVLTNAHSTLDPRLPTATIIGACKIGGPAAGALGQRLLEDWRRANLPVRKGPRAGGKGLRFIEYRKCVEEGERNGPPQDGNLGVCWQKPTITTTRGRALYLALKRLGLGADADRMAKHMRTARWKRDWGNIDPSSPINVCTDNLGP